MSDDLLPDRADDPVGASTRWSVREISQSTMDDAMAWLDAQLDSGLASVRPAPAHTLPRAYGTRRSSRRDETFAPSAMRRREPPVPVARRRSGWRSRMAPTACLVAMFDIATAFHDLLVARVLAIGFLLVVPGAVMLAASRTRPADGAVRLTLAAAASTLYLMLLGLAADVALPLVGVAEPLARLPMLVAVNATIVPALAVVARRREPLAELFGVRLPSATQVAIVGALALVPASAAGGAQAVDHGHGSTIAIVTVAVTGCLLLSLVVLADRLPRWFIAAALYTASVAIVYSFAFSGDLLFGWDIQQEFQAFSATMQAGTWHTGVARDPYRAMLSITELPTVLAGLTGMSGVSLFRGVYPLLFAAFPVMVYSVASRWLPKVAAVAAAAFVIAQSAYSQQLPAIARQEIALVFFGVLAAVAFDDTLPVRYRQVVALVAGSSLALTHYSTAYVTSAALLGAWLLGGVFRAIRRRDRPPRVITSWVVLGILGVTVMWNFGVTRSSDNVFNFAEQAAERGPEFLPGGQGRTVIDKWLTGNAPQDISGEEYGRRIALIYETGAPWLNGYPADVVADHPVTNASAPRVDGPVPAVSTAAPLLLVLVSQGYVALTGLGIVVFAWQRRREWSSAPELAAVGVVLLAFVALMRVSGVAAEAYNQERAQIHAAVVLSIGFASVVAWLLARWRRLALVGVAGALAVVYFTSSGLAARIGGGAAPANLVDAGDARERFDVTDTEVAAATWLGEYRYPDSLVYTDRYGKLRIWAAAAPIVPASLLDALTPATLDRNAYVFASEANFVGGRARGAIGSDFAVYVFPRALLDANKALIYSTASTAVYR